MASAVAAKPVLSQVKSKRPQPPAGHISKPVNPTSSPSVASKRLPGQKGPPPTPTVATNGLNGNVARNKQRKEQPRNGEVKTYRSMPRDNGLDGRAMRKTPSPLVTKEEHILTKYKGQPPSLIIHLHQTYFRFDQQDGSFSYQSEMRFFIEHLQKRTVPHDILDELKQSGVRFYDGWLIVRVVDHKSSAAATSTSSASPSDDKSPFSIHNYTPYITPSPWVPYPSIDQPKPSPKQPSPSVKSETNGLNKENQNGEGSKKRNLEPKVYHVALRPTALSQHQDVIIDSMTPDPKATNKNKQQVASRTPGTATSGAPPTPLSAVPSTPTLDRGHLAKRQKMKVEPKDLPEYEARLVNATAPPLWLEPVSSLEEAENLLDFMKDPFHDEEPPSPKGRKRTVAELAADEAIAKEEERFMLVMDERLAPGAGGANGGGAAGADGPTGIPLFQPRFEKFNALETIKAQHKENKRLEHEKKVQADHQRRVQQEQVEEQRRQHEQNQQSRERDLRIRQQAAARAEQVRQAQQAAQQQQLGMQQPNGVIPAIQHQQQMLQAAQAQRSSPVVRTMSPQVVSSPVVGNLSQPGHSVPMNVTTSNQGGSPPRPGSAVQHGHPGVQMARNPSQAGRSQQGTPQMPHGTPSIRQATPVMRAQTPSQRINVSSPHTNMMAATPQMAQMGMAATPQMAAAQMSAQQAMIQQRQQQMLQQQMQAQGQQMSPNDLAHFQAQQHVRQQHQLLAQQQMMQQVQGQHHSPLPNGGPNQQAYNAQVAQMMRQQMSHVQGHGQGGQGSPQQHGMPMQANQQQRPPSQGGPTNTVLHQRFQHHRNTLLRQVAQSQYGGQPNLIPQQQLEAINQKATQNAKRDVMMMQQRHQQLAMQGMQQQGQNPQQQMMLNQQMQAQLMAQMQAQQQRNQQQMGNQNQG